MELRRRVTSRLSCTWGYVVEPTVHGWNPARKPPVWNPINNGINYQPQLVKAGFQPSTVGEWIRSQQHGFIHNFPSFSLGEEIWLEPRNLLKRPFTWGTVFEKLEIWLKNIHHLTRWAPLPAINGVIYNPYKWPFTSFYMNNLGYIIPCSPIVSGNLP